MNKIDEQKLNNKILKWLGFKDNYSDADHDKSLYISPQCTDPNGELCCKPDLVNDLNAQIKYIWNKIPDLVEINYNLNTRMCELKRYSLTKIYQTLWGKSNNPALAFALAINKYISSLEDTNA